LAKTPRARKDNERLNRYTLYKNIYINK